MKMTSSTRFAVRTALVTGTTLATIVGAQALVSLDESSLSKTPQAVVAPAELTTQPTGSAPSLQPPIDVPAVAPNIVILRHAGQVPAIQNVVPETNADPANRQSITIQPPNPVQVVVPQPVPQQSAPIIVARTGSSR